MSSLPYRLVDKQQWIKVLIDNRTAAHGRLGARRRTKGERCAGVLLLKYWLQPITLQRLEKRKERHVSVAGQVHNVDSTTWCPRAHIAEKKNKQDSK